MAFIRASSYNATLHGVRNAYSCARNNGEMIIYNYPMHALKFQGRQLMVSGFKPILSRELCESFLLLDAVGFVEKGGLNKL